MNKIEKKIAKKTNSIKHIKTIIFNTIKNSMLCCIYYTMYTMIVAFSILNTINTADAITVYNFHQSASTPENEHYSRIDNWDHPALRKLNSTMNFCYDCTSGRCSTPQGSEAITIAIYNNDQCLKLTGSANHQMSNRFQLIKHDDNTYFTYCHYYTDNLSNSINKLCAYTKQEVTMLP